MQRSVAATSKAQNCCESFAMNRLFPTQFARRAGRTRAPRPTHHLTGIFADFADLVPILFTVKWHKPRRADPGPAPERLMGSRRELSDNSNRRVNRARYDCP